MFNVANIQIGPIFKSNWHKVQLANLYMRNGAKISKIKARHTTAHKRRNIRIFLCIFSQALRENCSKWTLLNTITHRYLGNLKDPSIISYGANDYGDAIFTIWFFHKPGHTSKRNWWTIYFAHEKTSEDDPVKLGICTSRQEAVQLWVTKSNKY